LALSGVQLDRLANGAKKSFYKTAKCSGEKLLNIQADEWFMQYHFKYKENLLTSITHSAMPRKPEEDNFFSNLHLFYSCRISHNAKIQCDRNQAISSIQKSTIYNQLLTQHENLGLRVSLIPAFSAEVISSRIPFFTHVARFFFRIYKELVSSRKGKLISRYPLMLVNASGLKQKLHSLVQMNESYKVKIEEYVLDKIEIVALVELMMLLDKVKIAKTILDHTRSLFIHEPDSIWFDQNSIRCAFYSKDETGINRAGKPFNIYRIVEDSIKPSAMTFVLKAYIVEEDVILSFQNKVGIFQTQLPREDECFAINNLSLALKRDSNLLSQGESRPTTDLFIGPLGRNLINLDNEQLVAMKTQEFDVYDGEFVPFLLSSAGISNYWHALIESLPRLVLLDDNQPIILLGEPPSEIVELIKLLRPRAKMFTYLYSGVILNSVLRSPLSVLSKEPFWSGESPSFDFSTLLKFRNELSRILVEISNERSEFNADKVFLIRSSTHRKSEIEKLKNLLENQGFVSIDPSDLNINEQAKVFSAARVVVGEVGAVWANLIFCAPGTKIFSLCGESSAPTPLFGGFAQILGLDFCPIAFPDAWSYSPEMHWGNTPEAFFQSGFRLTDENVTRTANFISMNSILN
jgi:hypothetical protein